MQDLFKEINKKFGFGSMRLPTKNGVVDDVEFTQKIDIFIENGFNYVDTATG